MTLLSVSDTTEYIGLLNETDEGKLPSTNKLINAVIEFETVNDSSIRQSVIVNGCSLRKNARVIDIHDINVNPVNSLLFKQ